MKFLLDTDTCIYYLKGVQPVASRMLVASAGDVAICRITQMELFFGAYHSALVEHNLKRVRMFSRSVVVLDLDEKASETFGRIKSALRRKGVGVSDFDLAIAATALTWHLVMVTNNVRHFEPIPGLKVENWTTALPRQ